jgi:hypothetical protein
MKWYYILICLMTVKKSYFEGEKLVDYADNTLCIETHECIYCKSEMVYIILLLRNFLQLFF